jgi:hypothetical protein
LQPKDSATNPSDNNKVSNVLSSIKLVISDESFKTINDSKTVEVAIDTNNDSLIASVDFLLDGKVAGRSIEAPFVVTISLAQLAVGEHKLQAIAYDAKGNSVKSKEFTFTIEPGEVVPTDDSSSDMVGALPTKQLRVVTASTSGSGNSGGNSGGDSGNGGDGGNGGDPGDPGTGDGTRTAGGWWASLPGNMQICSNGVLNGGPASAPAGAITVPSGDNKSFNFNQDNKTFWFAPGVHTIGTDPVNDRFGGITPGTGSTYIGAPGAILDGKNAVQYAFKGNVDNVRVAYLEVQNFGRGNDNNNEGVINHDAGDGWTMEYLNAHNNDGAAVFMGSQNIVRYNCLKDNGQYGFSMFKSPINGDSAIKDIVITQNEISGNNQDDWETQIPGCGCTGAGKFWDVKGATVTNNYVHDNLSTGLWADTNDIDFLFDSNWIEHNRGEGIWYEISYNATISRNVMKRNAWYSGTHNTGSPGPAIYISESGGDSRLQSSTSGSTNLQIKNNLLEDNFSGVSIYENSNRFCNSNGNTSTGYCTPFITPTMIPEPHDTTYPNPVSTNHPCYTQIKNAPYTANCRWHSKNVQVFNNQFHFDDTVVPCAGSFCGAQALFATGSDNMNNTPPYQNWVPTDYNIANVQADVMFNNNNKFYNNEYVGRWRFAKGYGETINFSSWQTGNFMQDAGSTYSAPPVDNYIDSNTATLEGGMGHWQPWYSADDITQSSAEAHTGTHSLRVAVTSSGGWGVNLDNYPGFETSPGTKHVSFWAKQGSGAIASVKLSLTYFDVNNAPIKDAGNNTIMHTITLSGLTTSWQEGSMDADAPVNTAKVMIGLQSSSGSVGNTLYLDDFKIGDPT